MYKAHGYSILSITDHETPKSHSYLSDSEFLAITGYETYVRTTAECCYVWSLPVVRCLKENMLMWAEQLPLPILKLMTVQNLFGYLLLINMENLLTLAVSSEMNWSFKKTLFGGDVEKLKQADADSIAITGDMIDSRRTNVDIALSFAKEAARTAPHTM